MMNKIKLGPCEKKRNMNSAEDVKIVVMREPESRHTSKSEKKTKDGTRETLC